MHRLLLLAMSCLSSTIDIRVTSTQAKLSIRSVRHHNRLDSAANCRIIGERFERSLIGNVHNVNYPGHIRCRWKQPHCNTPRVVADHLRCH
jgi:hypothetical protein